MSLNKRVGFIGAGQMAEALARGFVARGVVTVSAITATDPVAARKDVFKSFGASVTGSNAEVREQRRSLTVKREQIGREVEEKTRESIEDFRRRRRRCWPIFLNLDPLKKKNIKQVVQSSDIIFIAVKPQYVSTVLQEIRPVLADRHVIVSIAAGVTMAALKVRNVFFGSFQLCSLSLSLYSSALTPLPLSSLTKKT